MENSASAADSIISSHVVPSVFFSSGPSPDLSVTSRSSFFRGLAAFFLRRLLRPFFPHRKKKNIRDDRMMKQHDEKFYGSKKKTVKRAIIMRIITLRRHRTDAVAGDSGAVDIVASYRIHHHHQLYANSILMWDMYFKQNLYANKFYFIYFMSL